MVAAPIAGGYAANPSLHDDGARIARKAVNVARAILAFAEEQAIEQAREESAEP